MWPYIYALLLVVLENCLYGFISIWIFTKKQKENERGDGKEGEEDRDIKRQKVEEISILETWNEVGKQ